MPYHGEGTSFLRMAAKQGYSLFNIKHMTLFELAKNLIHTNVIHTDIEHNANDPGEKEIISAQKSHQVIFTILQRLQEEEELKYFHRLKPTITISSMIYNAIYELRMAQIDINNIKLVSSAKEKDIARIYHEYCKFLEENDWLDEPSVFSLAKEKINNITNNTTANITHPIYFINTDFYNDLTHLEKELLNTLPEENLYFLSDPLKPGSYEKHGEYGGGYHINPRKIDFYLSNRQKNLDYDFCKAYGDTAEIKWIFSKIKKEELSFDRVTVLYTSSSPYVELFYQFMDNYDLPCTFGEGISIYHTRPGKLSYMLIEWIRSDFQVLEFARIMSESIFDLKQDELSKEELSPLKVRRMLREAGVGWSKERYLDMLEAKINSLKEKDQESKYIKKELKSYQVLYKWLEGLLSLLPEFEVDDDGYTKKIKLSKLSQGLKEIIKSYSRIFSPADKEAREKLLEELEVTQSVGDNYLELGDGLDLIEENISNARVNKDSPRPGHIHIDHYLNGRYKLRDHLFLMGLDGDRFPGQKSEDPVLLDEERKNLSDKLPLQKQIIDKNHLEMKRLLTLQNPFTSLNISYSSFDTIEHREKFPSSLILSIYREVFDEPWADYSRLEEYLNSNKRQDPSPGELSEIFAAKDLWLYLYRTSQSISQRASQSIWDHYPHWQRGIKAEENRLSEAFTPYDGNIISSQETLAPGNDLKSKLEGKQDKNTKSVISPTRLEFLASCPFAYFLRYVLRIEPPEDVEYDPTAWLDSLSRGQLLHSIFEEFYREIIDRSDLPVKEKHIDEVIKMAKQWIESQREEIPPPSELVYSYERSELLNSVKVFLQSELDYAEISRPVLLEFYLDQVPLVLPSGKKIYIQGKIDRVDEDAEGRYLALDYKTGSTYSYSEQKYYQGGRQLQHALYALALEEKLKELYPDREIEVRGGGYIFPTVKGEGDRYIRYYCLEDKEDFLALLDNLLGIMNKGDFVMTDDENDCKFCDYPLVCERGRYSEVLALLHESEPELELLRQVRNYE
ncbi:PD-(D/E)XK nuclease superfamily protein [Natranaerofaba carboxydovora]|nr:PD-(D/E)XK nuclease superfamily protein [Natranaerofaba carboxydovora]